MATTPGSQTAWPLGSPDSEVGTYDVDVPAPESITAHDRPMPAHAAPALLPPAPVRTDRKADRNRTELLLEQKVAALERVAHRSRELADLVRSRLEALPPTPVRYSA